MDTTNLSQSNEQSMRSKNKRHNPRPNFFRVSATDFKKIPGSPIAYWASEKIFDTFTKFPKVSDYAETRIGLITGDNETHIRYWQEVNIKNVGFEMTRKEAKQSGLRWFPQSKGGDFRRWYGNNETVVNWRNDGHELQTTMHSSGERILAHNFNLDRIFQPAITWTKISSGDFAARMQPTGFLFNDASANAFVDNEKHRLVILGFLGTKLPAELLKILNPTLNFLPGNISSLPLDPKIISSEEIISNISEAVSISRTDWDSFETSWDFARHPLLPSQSTSGQSTSPSQSTSVLLSECFASWESTCNARRARLKELEEENNRLFIEAYGLQDELSPEVPEDQITLARPDARRDMAALLSYAVGCMMGRYSLEKPGLILANAGENLEDYKRKVASDQWPVDSKEKLITDHWPLTTDLTTEFLPDADGIVPILDDEWSSDDIVARTREFLRVVYGESTLSENVRFIEDALGKELRKYFQTDFYKDHLQTYKKRPIYWLAQSPKKGFNALIYLHRYSRDTMNVLLNRYLREYQNKLRAHITQLQNREAAAATPREKTAALKEIEKQLKVLHECEEWERETVLPLAQARIELDLDDGVKVNYQKLGDALAPIPGVTKRT